MFTGLIQAIGSLRRLQDNLVHIDCGAGSPILVDLAIGDSVAVDGVCLTVTKILPGGFWADVSPETLQRTTLGQQSGEIQVNLEPSLRVGSKLGGHFVTGHIDGVGYLESAVPIDNAWELSFRVPSPHIARYIVPKGSIAINGVSLTVANCDDRGNWFQVAVIPLTYADTNLQYLKPNAPVNLEGDVLGKYVERFLRLGGPQTAFTDPQKWLNSPETGDITVSFLSEHGYG